MFEVGVTVLYGVEGVCQIKEIVQKEIGGQKKDYLVLEPMHKRNSTVFIPMENETLLAKMRKVLSAEEIRDLVETLPEEPLAWIDDEGERKAYYKELITQGQCRDLMQLARTLHLRQKEQEAKGKKMYASDTRYLKMAEKMIHDEFSVVFDIDLEEVLPFILKKDARKLLEVL